MQVSFACTEHNLKSRSEDRLCGLRTAPPPGGSSGGVGGGGGGGGGGSGGGGGGGGGSGGGSSGQGSNGNYMSQGSVKTREGSGSRQTPQGHAHMKEAIGRHTNMKYRWVWAWLGETRSRSFIGWRDGFYFALITVAVWPPPEVKVLHQKQGVGPLLHNEALPALPGLHYS